MEPTVHQNQRNRDPQAFSAFPATGLEPALIPPQVENVPVFILLRGAGQDDMAEPKTWVWNGRTWVWNGAGAGSERTWVWNGALPGLIGWSSPGTPGARLQ